jgi:hypothetical protein
MDTSVTPTSRLLTSSRYLLYPNKLDQSLNDEAADKIRKYRADYNNRSPNTVSFMPAVDSTSGRLHDEFVRLLFLQTHRETDRFFPLQEFILQKHNVACSTTTVRLFLLFPLQEFSQRNQIWEYSSTFTVRLSLRCLNHESHRFPPKLWFCVLILT